MGPDAHTEHPRDIHHCIYKNKKATQMDIHDYHNVRLLIMEGV